MVAKIKFCGIMQAGEAAVAAEAGAAYLGVVFAGGARAMTVADAARLRAHGLGVWRVLRISIWSSAVRPEAGSRARWLSPGV